MFVINEKGEKEFLGGMENWNTAELSASMCGSFKPDVEEELVADHLVSCYNCKYRRWTVKSFQCVRV